MFWRKYNIDDIKDQKVFYVYARTKQEAIERFLETSGVSIKDVIEVRRV